MFPLSPPAPQKRLLHRDPPDQHTSHWLWLGWRGCCRLEEPVFSGQLNPSSASRSPNRFPGGWKGHCVPFHVGSDTGGESGASWGGETRPKSANGTVPHGGKARGPRATSPRGHKLAREQDYAPLCHRVHCGPPAPSPKGPQRPGQLLAQSQHCHPPLCKGTAAWAFLPHSPVFPLPHPSALPISKPGPPFLPFRICLQSVSPML